MGICHKYIFLLLFFLFPGFTGFGQQTQLQFTHVDMSDGLSHNQVNCILKDSTGFMWFGTLSGLNRYDGYSFKIFRHEMEDSTSLSDNFISGIFELPDGKLWINTRNGSDIYNPSREIFNRNFQAYLDSLSLPPTSDGISKVVKDKKDNYWFIYVQEGLYRYNPQSKKHSHLQYYPNNPESLSNNDVADMAIDHAENIWVIQGNGILEKIDPQTLQVVYRNDSLLQMNNGVSLPYKTFIDNQNDLWIYVVGDPNGVFYFNTATNRFLRLTKDSRPYPLNNDIIYGITQDSKGLIWIGTDHGGINILNKGNFSISYLMHNPEDRKSLAQNSIYSLYKDNTGLIWVGTYKKGICYYNETFNRFPLYSHDPSNKNSLPYEDVNRFIEDKAGNLWIGANGGGLIYFDRKRNTFKQYLHDSHNINSLSNNVVVSMCIDYQGKLWIGTYTGGLDCFDGKNFIHYSQNPNDSTSLSNNKVWDIYEDKKQRLWIGTLGGGLNQFDRKTNSFIHYASQQKQQGIAFVSVVTEDKKGNLWIGTAAGVEVFNPETKTTNYYNHIPGDSNSLSNDNVNVIFQDSRGWMWIGCREGLNLFDPVTKKFRNFTIKDGLPDNTVLTVLEDHEHRIWLSTPHGLSFLTIYRQQQGNTFSFRNYNESDGLQGRQFNDKSAYKTREGELIFGGANGFNLFDPDQIKLNKDVPPVVFTDLQIFNKSIAIGDIVKNHTILPRSITEMKAVTIPYEANDFSIVFAALGYIHSDKNGYAYKLKGFNDNWVLSNGETHRATYTNLDPGEYTFMVKNSNNDDVWNEKVTTLHIKILPPFWRTVWAYILYVLLILGILYLARSILLYRARMKFKIAHQEHEAQRMHELDMMKIRFFTNISHEFRTPLSLIISPLDKLVKQTPDIGHQNQLKLVQRNAKRLLHLVNQLLDFRKMEVQEIKLNPLRADVVQFIKETVFSFTDIAEKKNIHFSLKTSLQSLQANFDPDKLERILFNLLSNAFKFTPENGKIVISIDLNVSENKANSDLIIRVKDNGIGIPFEKQQYIFERFFQHSMPASIVNPGNGIGLAITHEFVRLHNGTISVESESGKGSCFTVSLPVATINNEFSNNGIKTIPLHIERPEMMPADPRRKKYTILLIDDNEDFRFYLKDNIGVYFNVLEASDGKGGWEKAVSQKPDLIVSDIMMPAWLNPADNIESDDLAGNFETMEITANEGMNGLALAKRLKRDPRTAHIPLILLTARASEEQRLEGFETGANDYITKPFNFEILLARIRNLLEEIKRQRKNEPSAVPIAPSAINITPEDDKFLNEARAVVEKNIANPNFSVEDLSAALFISRVTLYKKLSSITGKTPVAFIRMLRIKRAAELIKKGKMNVSQAAYEVGFNNPKYFTKYFKEEFGVSPSEYGRESKSDSP